MVVFLGFLSLTTDSKGCVKLQESTFVEAAYQVLKDKRQPSRASVITSNAQRKGCIKTTGTTPAATMVAQICMDLRIRRATFNLEVQRALEKRPRMG
ncbi:winged helix-turn-helix domain-containing protein, partial [candidate division WOR-3 bacterium]|nr:winged helix-turn-helix domain-containing protein [candidate division WOR-3 bacterium]